MDRISDTLNVASHSGAVLRAIKSDQGLVVEKQFNRNGPRCRANIGKQQVFQTVSVRHHAVNAVPIVSVNEMPEGLAIQMPYIEGVSAEGFAVHGTASLVSHVNEVLTTLLNHAMSSSENQLISPRVFIDKAEEVLINTQHQEIRSWVGKVVERIHVLADQEMSFPMGQCHGDLTFSNIIVVPSGDIYLIDFLETFLESPLQDLAKIIQDVRFGWSFRYLKQSVRVKADIFCRNVWSSDMDVLIRRYPVQIEILTLMTLIRIAPYVDDETSLHWLESSLKRALAGPSCVQS